MDPVQVEDQLIARNGCQDLSAVVVQSAMPHVLLKLKSFFEPRVEGLCRHAATGIQALADRRTPEGGSGLTMSLPRLSSPRSLPPFLRNSSRIETLDQRTHEAAACATPFRRPFDGFGQVVGVVRLIGQNRFCATRKLR